LCTKSGELAGEAVDLEGVLVLYYIDIKPIVWRGSITHTTASCSFSHSEYSSAAVKGLGCLSGPSCSWPDETRCGICMRSAGTVGGAIVCDVRLEFVAERVVHEGVRVCSG
jgi:hypothetical protein